MICAVDYLNWYICSVYSFRFARCFFWMIWVSCRWCRMIHLLCVFRPLCWLFLLNDLCCHWSRMIHCSVYSFRFVRCSFWMIYVVDGLEWYACSVAFFRFACCFFFWNDLCCRWPRMKPLFCVFLPLCLLFLLNTLGIGLSLYWLYELL